MLGSTVREWEDMSKMLSSFKEFLSTERRLTATMCLLSLTVHMWAAIWKYMHSSPISYCLSAHPPVSHHLCNSGGGHSKKQKVLHSLKSWRNDSVEHVNSELTAKVIRQISAAKHGVHLHLPSNKTVQSGVITYSWTNPNVATREFDKLRKTWTSA